MSTDGHMPELPTTSSKIRSEVAIALALTGPTVRTLVIEKLAQDEIERRKTSVLTVLDKLDAKHKEIKKAEKEGVVSFNSAGIAIGSPAFTKDQVEKLKQMYEATERMQKALEKAFD